MRTPPWSPPPPSWPGWPRSTSSSPPTPSPAGSASESITESAQGPAQGSAQGSTTRSAQGSPQGSAPGSALGAAQGSAQGSAETTEQRLQRLLALPVEETTLDHGTSRYVPPPALRRHVHTRDATCIGPACHHSARGTQLDHTLAYRDLVDGTVGMTSAANLGSGCRRVHNGKTHGGWRLRQPTPDTFHWTSPTGRTYQRRARPLIPGWRWLREDQPP